MILLDTDLLIYASNNDSEYRDWSRQVIAAAVAGDGAAINFVSMAEVYVGEEEPETAADRIHGWSVEILEVPAAAADVCAKAYRRYRQQRGSLTDKEASAVPLPEFFIGAFRSEGELRCGIFAWPLSTGWRGWRRAPPPCAVGQSAEDGIVSMDVCMPGIRFPLPDTEELRRIS